MTDVPDPQPPGPPAFPPAPPTVPHAPIPPVTAPQAPPAPPPIGIDVLPAYAPPPPEPPKRGGRGKIVGLAVAIVVALAAGAFAVNALQSSSSGASTPDEAVAKLFEAVSNEDAIGVLDTLDPGERDLLLPSIQGANDQLARLGLVKSVDLGKVPGFDIEVTGLETKSQEIFDGVSKVDITAGHATFSTRPDAVPVGDVLRDLIEATGSSVDIPETSEETALGGGDSDYVVAVKGDGGWYVSLFFSIAEQARLDAGLDPPDPAAAVQPEGASSPEQAVTDFLNAIGSLDVRSIIAHLPPGEARALQLYAPLFLDDAQQSAESLTQDEGFKVEFSDLDLATADGELGKIVKINGGTVSLTMGDGTLSVTLKDGCASFSAKGEATDFLSELTSDIGQDDTTICQDDLASSLSDQLSGSSDEGPFAAFGELGNRLQKAELGLVAVQDGGAWYVSPTRTVLELLLQMLKTFDKADFVEGGLIYDLIAGG